MEEASRDCTRIRISPAGWSYQDWAGQVYPSRSHVALIPSATSRSISTPSRSIARSIAFPIRRRRGAGASGWRIIPTFGSRPRSGGASPTRAPPVLRMRPRFGTPWPHSTTPDDSGRAAAIPLWLSPHPRQPGAPAAISRRVPGVSASPRRATPLLRPAGGL